MSRIYLVILFAGVTMSKTMKANNQVILDVSQVIQDWQQFGKWTKAENMMDSIIKHYRAHKKPYILFYETDLNLNASLDSNLRTMTTWLGKDSSAKLLISIRASKHNFKVWMDNNQHYTNLLDTLNQYSTFITGITFQITDLDNASQSMVSLVEQLKKSAMNTSIHSQNRLKVGYTVDYFHRDLHNENVKHADFIVVNLPITRNDKMFVESYGAFKDNMENVAKEVLSSIIVVNHQKASNQSYNANLYIRLSLDAKIEMNLNGTFHLEIHSLVNNTQNKLKDATSRIYAPKYGSLLRQYCQSWVKDTMYNVNVVLYTKQYETLTGIVQNNFNESANNALTIPYVTNIPIKDSLNKEFQMREAVGLLLEDVAASGFDTIAIDGDDWQTMAKDKNEYLPTCLKFGCRRPSNVFYFNNQHKAFSRHNKSETQKLATLDGMHISTLVFSNLYQDDDKYNWSEVVKTLADTANWNWNANLKRKVQAACTEHGLSDVFSIVHNATCDNTCTALELQKVFGCSSIKNSSIIVWKRVIKLENERMDDFVEKTMKKLDAFIIARTMITTRNSNTKVILQIKVEHSKNNHPIISLRLYCNDHTEKFARIYEVILTWLDFPIILDPDTNAYGYSNPIAWHPLSVSRPAKLQKTMQSAPLFIRRNYFQSKYSNWWTKGMYPCLPQLTKQESLVSLLNLNRDFVGVTLKMDLRHDNTTPISPKELQTLLMIALGNFSAVEIIISQNNHLNILAESLSQPSFVTTIGERGLKGSRIYINFKNTVSMQEHNAIPQTRDLVTTLQQKGSLVYVHFPFPDTKLKVNLRQRIAASLGYNHENCADLAHQLVYKGKQNSTMDKVDYIICQTDSIPVTNKDRATLQDNLESHLYMKKLFHHFYPNLKQVHFRLEPKLQGETTKEKSMNLLQFLADVNNFAKGHEIHYFSLSALPRESNDQTEGSFWTVKNYSNLTDLFIYQERHAEALKQISSTATPNEENSSFHVATAVVPLVLLMLVLFIILWGRKYRYLSEKEYRDFVHGRKETLQEAVIVRKQSMRTDITVNVFNGLVYQKDCEISKKEITLNKKNMIGKGKFSRLYRATTQNGKKELTVEIHNGKCSKNRFKALINETKMLCYVGNHENILGFFGCYTKEIRKGVMWIVKEYCNEGNLLAYLQQSKKRNDFEIRLHEMIRFAKEIACGMEYLHSQIVVHGDLRAKYVYLNQYKVCKVGNFGLERKRLEYEALVKEGKQALLPWRWMSWEVLQSMDFSNFSDVWAYGVTVWEIFSVGKLPYETGSTVSPAFIDELINGMRLHYPTHATPAIYDAMQQCWALQPEKRVEFPKLIKLFTEMLPSNLEV